MKEIIVIPMFFIMTGCTRAVYTPIVHTERVVDTVTQQVEDSLTIRALFECDSLGRVVLRELTETKGRLASHQMSVQNGEVKVVTRWQTKYIDRIREVHDTTTVVELKEVVREVAHVPKFFWWCFGISAATALVLCWRAVRRFV